MKKYTLPVSKSIGFCQKSFYEEIKTAKDLGYEYIDFDIANQWRHPFKEAKYYRNIEKGLAAVKEAGLKINAVHISFGTRWDPSELRTSRRKKIVKKIVRIIKRVDQGNPFCYVLHGSFEPILPQVREEKKKALLSSLPEICSATENYVCLENLPRTCLLNTSQEAMEILDRAGIENLKICLDTNHFLKEKTEDAIYRLGKNIKTLHVSDGDYINERHWLPGKGKLNWNAIIEALDKTGYEGVFNYEVDRVTLQDLKENHKTLFDRYNGENEE